MGTEESSKKRDRKSEDKHNLPLEVHIRNERKRIEQERSEVPDEK